MRHAMKHRKLGRTSAHREALFRNQLQSLIEHERIVTTLPKAKELRPIAEKLITRGKLDTVPARRWVLARMRAQQPKVPISAGWSHDTRAYWFQRTTRA